MSEQPKYHSFTHQDIERYHKGLLSPAEMHAMEKAALEDPFLADALEGYAFTSTPEQDLANIRARLEERTSSRKAVPLVFRTYTWIKAAAVVLLIAGSGWLIFRLFTVPGEKMALEQKSVTPAVSDSVAFENKTPPDSVAGYVNIRPDSSASVTVHFNAVEKPKPAPEKFFMKTEAAAATGNQEKAVPEESVALSKSNKDKEEKAVTDDVAPVTSNAVNDNYFRNRTTNTRPIPGAETAERKKAPSGLYKSRQVPTASDSATAMGYRRDQGRVAEQSAERMDSLTDMQIVLSPLPKDSSMKEVVVSTQLGGTKKTAYQPPLIIIDTLEPAEGTASYDSYIASNLRSPEKMQLKPVSGEVQLSFDVDENGRAVNITVLKSLCDKCDEEAIRLLREGPKWKKKKNRKGKVTIRF